MSDISLNSGIRSNLLQLQSTSKLFTRTTDRLASGRKVNSAIDNPTNFFASINLSDRAEALSGRLDGMGQAIQTIKSADNGISTIRSFVSAMKGVVNNAIGNINPGEREALGKQFNELIIQVRNTAKDSAYQGVNLLQGNATSSIQFNETFDDSRLDIKGINLLGPGSDGLAVLDSNGEIPAAAETAVIQIASQAEVESVSASGYAGTDGTNTDASATVSLAGASGFTASDAAETSVIGTAAVASSAAGTSAADVAMFLANQTGGTTVGIQGAGSQPGSVDWTGSNYKNTLSAVIQQLEAFETELKVQAGNLAQNLSAVTIREEFNSSMINTLREGSDRLVLADLNEEGANLLALQTASQLATQSLSLASQQAQGVLQLLG